MTVTAKAVGGSSLTEIVQANAIGSNTCRILVTTPPGRGVIFVEAGEIVDAAYGDLSGEVAFHALINAEVLQTQVSTGLKTANRRISSGWQALIAQAMTLRFEGRLPVPSFPEDRSGVEATVALGRHLPLAPPVPVAPARDAAPGAGAPAPAATPAPPPARREPARAVPVSRPQPMEPAPKRRTAVAVAIGLVVVAVLVGGLFLLRGRGGSGGGDAEALPAPGAAAPAPVVAAMAPSGAAVEATDLKDPRDSLPKLLSGPAPKSPNPESALFPTIVCRLLVGEDGSVREASVFRSRLDQAAFEDAAIAAVKGWRFHPGRRGDRPVAVWINWPVSFQQ